MESNKTEKINTVVLLGPTAVGKTSLGVRLADYFNWDIISADSRQIYKGLDLGSGKDINEYTITKTQPDGTSVTKQIPYHLIDITTLHTEYNVFNFQTDFYNLLQQFQTQNKMAFIVGGTGMYIDSIVRGYDFVPVPENPQLRKEFQTKTLEELAQELLKLKPDLHNKSDLLLRDRVERALEIAIFNQSAEGKKLKEKLKQRPKVNPLVIGTTVPRDILHNNIKIRLRERIEQGMIDEVQQLHNSGFTWERLEKLGLEYRFVSQYLEGKISTPQEMEELLYHAISQFAKRQETWFRGMQKKGVTINWLSSVPDKDIRFYDALKILDQHGIKR